MNSSAEMTVGQLAKRSGVAVSTIHFYEAKGLISGWRTAGNQRRYPRAVLRRVAVIRIAQRAGISLKTLQAFLADIPADHPLTTADWRALTTSWRALVETRIAALTQLRDQLESCIGCGCLSLADCPLRNPGDVLGGRGPGARILIEGGDAEER